MVEWAEHSGTASEHWEEYWNINMKAPVVAAETDDQQVALDVKQSAEIRSAGERIVGQAAD
jgi:hypothetical protein